MNFRRRIAKTVFTILIVLINASPLYANVEVTEEWKDKYIKRVERIEAFLDDKETEFLHFEADLTKYVRLLNELEDFLLSLKTQFALWETGLTDLSDKYTDLYLETNIARVNEFLFPSSVNLSQFTGLSYDGDLSFPHRRKATLSAVARTEEFLDILELKLFYLTATLSGMLDEKVEDDFANKPSLSFYTKILEDPNSTRGQIKNALEQAARINIQLGNFNEAIKICQEALEKFPQHSTFLSLIAEVYYFRAAAYQGERQYDLAIENLQKILALENLPPNWYAFATSFLAHLYFKQGQDNKALSYLQSIIQDYPNLDNWQGSAHYDLADYYLNQGKKTEAEEELQIIVTKHPNSDWAMPAKHKLKEIANNE